MGYPGYQRLFSHVAGISSVGRGPTDLRPSGTQAMNGVTPFRIFWGKKVRHISGYPTYQNVCTVGEK